MLQAPHRFPLPSTGSCAACGAEAPVWAPRLGFLVACDACGFIRMPDAVLAHTTDDQYDDEFFGDAYGHYLDRADEIRQTLRARLHWMEQWVSAGPLLEVGCAYGLFLQVARDAYTPCVGVDIAAKATQIGRDELGLDTRTGDVAAMAFPEAPFAAICAWDTLEHLPDPEATVRSLWTLLRPGGYFFFSTVDIDSRVARWRGPKWRMLHLPTHLHFWGRSSLDRFLRRLDFTPVAMTTAPVFRSLRGTCEVVAAVSPSAAMRLGGRMILQGCPAPLLNRLHGFVDLGDIVLVAARKDPADA